jgi:LmbE family N-acetylglucosaminyl deacetylase
MMRLSFANERVLAVMAHPDDAELLCAGTLARAKADGAAVGVCVMCQGDKGVAAGGSQAQLVETRKSEAAEAAKILSATLFWFGGRDGELFDDYENRRKLIEVFRQFRPTLVITQCPEDYHPDHRAAYAIAEAATWMAASRGQVTASAAIATAPGLWLADSIGMNGFMPEFYVDVSGYVETKQRMLACHRSQLSRGADSDFSPLEELMMRQCRARGEQASVEAAEAFGQHHAFKRVRAW